MFYVGDPNPNVSFGTSAQAMGGSATPTPTSTPTSITPRPSVTGSLSVTMSDTSAILSDSSVRTNFENAMAAEIAGVAGVAATDVTVRVSAGRRLDAASTMRRLASGVLSVSYTIIPSSKGVAAVARLVRAVTTTDLQTKVNNALTVASVSGVTATGVAITVAAAEQNTTPTPSPTPMKASTDFACGNVYKGRLVALAAVFATAQFRM
jgi:hypothetical protein